jgi:hypothetical protein
MKDNSLREIHGIIDECFEEVRSSVLISDGVRNGRPFRPVANSEYRAGTGSRWCQRYGYVAPA